MADLKKLTDSELLDKASAIESRYSGVNSGGKAGEEMAAVRAERNRRKNESATRGKTRLTTDDKRI